MISHEISKSLNCVNPRQSSACCFRFISSTLEYLKSRRNCNKFDFDIRSMFESKISVLCAIQIGRAEKIFFVAFPLCWHGKKTKKVPST